MKVVRPMQEPKPKIDPLSETELDLVLDNMDEHYRPLFTALAFTGARPNELFALRWGDIDKVRNVISISKGRVRGTEGLPKTRSGERLIPMTQQAIAALGELEARPVRSKNGYVFIEPDGQPVKYHLDRVWARALRKTGLRHRPSYQLRHTFASQCIMQGLSLPYVAKILGHSTIDSLIRNYAGWIDAYTKEQDDKLLKAFNGFSTTSSKTRKKSGEKVGV